MDPTQFAAALAAGEPIVLDGGLATELEAQGHDLSDALWSARLLAEDPDAITRAHLAYFRAGARVATTASYQATFEGFAARGIGRDEAAALIGRSVALATEARDRFVLEARDGLAVPTLFVAASIGPYGAMLADGSEYRGSYGRTIGQLRDFHRPRFDVLVATDADVLAVETIPEVEEAAALAELLTEAPGAAAWIAFSLRDGGHLRSGAPLEDALAAVQDTRGVVAVGVNCTAPGHIDEAVARIRAASPLPIVVYPNSGEGWDAVARQWTGPGGDRVDGAAALRWRHGGAQLIGGCCRVTPDQVAGLAAGLAAGPAEASPPR